MTRDPDHDAYREAWAADQITDDVLVRKGLRPKRPPDRLPGIIGLRISRREPAILAGWPGSGKSIAWARLVADATQAGENVAFFAPEDDYETVVIPRLIAAGADMERIYPLALPSGKPLTLEHSALILDTIDRNSIRIFIVDPIGTLLGKTDLKRSELVRDGLYEFAARLRDLDCTMIGIAHFNSAEGTSWTARIGGSKVYGERARSILIFGKLIDQDDPKDGTRYLAHPKNNYGRNCDTLRVHLDSAYVNLDDGGIVEVGVLRVVEEVPAVSDEDLLRKSTSKDELRRDAKRLILDILSRGPKQKQSISSEVAEELGCSGKTVQRAWIALAEQGRIVDLGTELLLETGPSIVIGS